MILIAALLAGLLIPTITLADVYYDGRYGGKAGWYSAPECNNPRCEMDNYIRALLAAQQRSTQSILQPITTKPTTPSNATPFNQFPHSVNITQSSSTNTSPTSSHQQTQPASTQYRLVTKTRQVPYTETVRVCHGTYCTYHKVTKYRTETYTERVPIPTSPATLAITELHPTPSSSLPLLGMLLSPRESDVVADLGCGDGRVLKYICSHYGCRGIGIELDASSFAKAKQACSDLPVALYHANILDYKSYHTADMVFMYLYTDLMKKVIPRLESGTKVVSYMHSPHPDATQYGDFYVWYVP